ncbi:Tetraspanin [Paragonimus heterotremus]|uniref:Tetraspanin n=1 Tax=Paragonimus heterotremus TaxID=100268 RepID=A0A8J4TAK6_9TREM|nr:Tetraspanin [Paragonimus heterotremus]
MAGLSLGMKCLKCAVFFFNVICFICALVLITVGVYVQVNFSSYGPELQKVWQAAPIAIIVLGAVILLVSFLGCCGAIKENVCMLYMYGVFLIILLIAELIAAVMAVVYKDKIDDEIEKILRDALKDYNKEEIRESIDLIQKTFECCGAKGREDYAGDVPESCGTYQEGCSEKFAQFLKQKMVIIACVAFGVCFIQILSAIIAFCLGNRIRNYDNI